MALINESGGLDAASTVGHTLTLPAYASGDLLIVHVTAEGLVHSGATWTFDGSTSKFAGLVEVQGISWYWGVYRVMQPGDTDASIAWSNDTASPVAWVVHRLPAGTFDPGTPPAVSWHAWSYGSGADPVNLAPPWGTESESLFLAVSTHRGGTMSGVPTGYTSLGARGNTDVGIGTAYRQLTAAADNPSEFTWSNAEYWTAATIAVRLVPAPALGLDVWRPIPPGNTVELAGTLVDGSASIRVERNGTGSGQFTMNRHSAEATAAMLAPGNIVRVTIPEIDPGYIFAFFMETGDFALVSSDEEGGEDVTIGGRGVLAYWDHAIWLSAKYTIPWWPATMATPPAGTRGAVQVAAGTYRRYTIAGGVITGYANFTTAGGFSAYYDTTKTYLWPSANSKRFLAHLTTTEDPASPDYTGYYFHPHQDGVTDTHASYTTGTTSSVLLSDISADKPGVVLYRLYQEGVSADRAVHPIPLMTIDFTETLDSAGNAWATTDALAGLTAELGETYLETIGKLVSTGAIDIEMGPDLVMHAWNAQGRDLTSPTFAAGKVRFAKGVNISDELRRERNDNPVATFIEVVGTDGVTATASLPDAATRVARETSATGDSGDPAVLAALGLAALNARLVSSDAIGLRIATGDDDAAGMYLPGPPGTAHGDFWLGDVITLHTGTAAQDFDQADERVYAITITTDDAGNLEVTPEVGSVLGAAERALYGSTTTVTSFTTRSPTTDTQVAESAHPDLATHDVLGLATDAELAAHTGDTTGAHAASAVSFTPTGTIAATDVQAAIAEVASEAVGLSLTVADEGTPLATDATTLDFVGAGVVASGAGATKTITIAGGGGVSGVTFAIVAVFDGGGSAITGNPEVDVVVPASGTITSATLLADTTGSAVIDVWSDVYGSFPPTVADTITASAKPTLSGAAKSQDVTLTGWDTALTAGDALRFHLDSSATVKRLQLTLLYTRS